MNKVRQLYILVLILCLYAFCVADAQKAHAEYAEAMQTIGTTFFTQAFKDSIAFKRAIVPAMALRTTTSLQFMQGEMLSFAVDWNFVNAGNAFIISKPMKEKGILLVTLLGFSNSFTSTFYHVRDGQQCEIDALGMYPLFFEEHLRENRYKADRWIAFDQSLQKAYVNGMDTALSIPAFSHSLVSSLCYLRTLPLIDRDSFNLDCVVQNKLYKVLFRCNGKETIKVPAGTFRCICVEPQLVASGRVFSAKDHITLWISDDSRRLPVMIRSRLAFGSLYVRLSAFQ